MADSLTTIIIDHNFVDICPSNISPTWDNGRSGEFYIAKRLDCFLLHDLLIERLGLVSFEIISCHISNHRPIILHWCRKDFHWGLPLKFNRIWLDDPSYSDIVKKIWCNAKSRFPSHMRSFMDKLWTLRRETKKWEINKKIQLNRELTDIDLKLKAISPHLTDHTLSSDIRSRIQALEKRRSTLLLQKETTWKLKSIAI